ncbi:uncharacterized protein LOC108666773 isoform X2 [Hyalella azteca]|uniref:Uncharacterized protein LOC108666773 isoform X1 n=1 Tax=Hyalella azteca TaxID=294128 RepID=A0A8B7N6E0_HYAAZ|nr:uncharacterized protein LOC108666773 isoform X1 [Hyalella azteca]XP_018009186.1 uncharacterized protein LOC108666773 isoform X2 [Hyalella azteca]
MSKNVNSPQQSPREDLDIDGSTYALQVALRNMKERYYKLQRKLSFIEEENQRLVHGKTELFGEIGVMQESSIKLREKNLQLNQEIHTKHQENCALRDTCNSLTHQNAALTRDNKRLRNQISHMREVHRALQQHAQLGGLNLPEMEAMDTSTDAFEEEALCASPNISRAMPATTNSNDDSSDEGSAAPLAEIPRPAVTAPRPRYRHSPPPASDSGSSEEEDSDCDSSYGSLYAATEDVSDRMDVIMDEVQRQNLALRALLPTLIACLDVGSEGGHCGTLQSQRDRELSTLTVNLGRCPLPAQTDCEAYDIQPDATTESGGGAVSDGPHSSSPPVRRRHHLSEFVGGADPGVRDIPPPEGAAPALPGEVTKGPEGTRGAGDRTHLAGGRGLPDAPFSPNLLAPAGAYDEDTKICPMCNVSFARDVTQDMFENHVVAHFEDINVDFEVV